ncbi:hypothetical protein ATY75_03305 [Rhizobium sp. N122]|uniref:hypothetical protein n=1 Tax=Rhizobium sp. N122 TaxID=1764272 RepID=UPI000B5AB49E|nr:hypothetical protein [Rhizobium sp. N122]OWV87351.1 hypothetical protein ATY75_03305 [Rhizobium sp. N122]
MAAAYVISYDLRKARSYDTLIKQLRDWGCVSPLESLWFGYLNGPAAAIRDGLMKHIDADDGLVVIEVKPTSDWAIFKANESFADWLRKYVGP